MKTIYKQILFKYLIVFGVIIAFQSCDFFSPLRDSKKKQKALKSKIDSLKTEHSKINLISLKKLQNMPISDTDKHLPNDVEDFWNVILNVIYSKTRDELLNEMFD